MKDQTELLEECIAQLEYLNEKFGETGTTNSLLSKLRSKTWESNKILSDSLPLSQQDKEDGILLLNRLKNISFMQTDEQQVKRMLTLIDATGFQLLRKQKQ